jgi:type I restriction enzyme, S subunit
MAQALYREWFVRFRLPGHEDARMVDSTLGSIPEGWEVAPLRSMVPPVRAGVDPARHPDEQFAHYSIPAFDEGQMPVTELGEAIKSNKFVVPSGCVLVSKINPRIPRVWLPWLDHPERGIASTEFLVLCPKSQYSQQYLYSLCRSDAFVKDLAGRAMGTSTSHQRVRPDDFLNLNAVCPPPQVVRGFTVLADPMFQEVHRLRQRNVNLLHTRDLLLPKLVSGAVDVEALDIDVEYD